MDNLAEGSLKSEHGLSFLVQTKHGSLLFDAGQSDLLMENMRACGVSAAGITAVALSHGHYDHSGGVASVVDEAPDVELFAHPMCFEPRYAKSGESMRYIGMPSESASLEPEFNVSRAAAEILPDVILSGEIPLKVEHTFNERFVAGENGLRLDAFDDEQCLIIRNDDTVIVLIGCAHRSVENNVFAAMEVAGVDKIDLLMGGMHLANAGEDRIASLVRFFCEVQVDRIVCCHCTGTQAFRMLNRELGEKVSLGRAGMSWRV